jgi:hypothetical protein
MAKQTRNEYLQERLNVAKTINPKTAINIPKNVTPAQLKTLDAQLNKVIYPSGVYGETGAAYKEPAATVVDPNAAQTASNRLNWKELLKTTLINWGLPTLVPAVQGYIDQGYTGETASLMIQNEPVYKERFAGNVARQKAGLSVLSPDEYLATESAYRQSMRAANLPTGFYDDPSDFSKFIANDVSPSELKSRVDAAALSINNADPYYTSSLEKMYGIGTGDMVAYALDPERALPFINKQVQAAQFGAEAARQGLQVTTPMAETYTGMGVTQQQARQGFEQVAGVLPVAQKLSQITAGSQPFGMEQAASAVFGGEQSAAYKKQLQDLSQQEQSRFAGQAGVGRGSLSRGMSGQI